MPNPTESRHWPNLRGRLYIAPVDSRISEPGAQGLVFEIWETTNTKLLFRLSSLSCPCILIAFHLAAELRREARFRSAFPSSANPITIRSTGDVIQQARTSLEGADTWKFILLIS